VNRQIRRLGIALVVLFLALIVQLNVLQVIKADELATDPRNSRNAERDFGQPRGRILTADGRVLAESIPNPDRTSPYAYVRRYPGGSLYGHLTGYFSFVYGTTGVERSYNAELAGRKVTLTAKRLKDLLSSKTITSDVTLTIDDRIQRAAAKALGNRRGSVVVIDPRTGALLAAVSTPRFDPTPLASTNTKTTKLAFERLRDDPTKPLLARAYRERYPPGSTFKAITASTGLETQVVGLTTPVYPLLRALPLRFTQRPLRNFGGSECGGTLENVFRISCNTSFAQMGLDLGPDRLHDGAVAFGFNRTPPLDLDPGAARSTFPEVPFFVRNDPALAQAAIGQGQVAATPLEMALVAGAVANRGVIMEPHVLAEVQDSDGNRTRSEPRNEWRRAISAETAAQVNQLMVTVVNDGTAKRAAISGVQVAAKTGTAQTGRNTAHAWIIGFAPAENPTVAISVIVENQPEVSTATGGKIAAPVARRVLEAALSTQAS
jgi:penicillin-binding protein A